jgi:hypothetical protein
MLFKQQMTLILFQGVCTMLQTKNKSQASDYKDFIQEFRSFRKKNPALPLSRCLDTLLKASSITSEKSSEYADRN